MQDTKEPLLVYVLEGIFLIFLVVVVGSIAYHLIAGSTASKLKKPKTIAGFIEAQKLEITRKSDPIQTTIQNTEIFENGVWSNDDHLFVYNVSTNDSLTFSLPIPEESSYQLTVYLSKSYDYGEWTIKIDGTQVKKVDLFSTIVEPAAPIDIGVHRLAPSKNVLVFESVGRNPKAKPPYYQLGIDGVVIKRVNETP